MMYVFEMGVDEELFLHWAIPYANFFVCSPEQQLDAHLTSRPIDQKSTTTSEKYCIKCTLLVIALFSSAVTVCIGATMAFICVRRMRKRKLAASGGGKRKVKKKRKNGNIKKTSTSMTSTTFKSPKSFSKSVKTSTKTPTPSKTTLKKQYKCKDVLNYHTTSKKLKF